MPVLILKYGSFLQTIYTFFPAPAAWLHSGFFSSEFFPASIFEFRVWWLDALLSLYTHGAAAKIENKRAYRPAVDASTFFPCYRYTHCIAVTAIPTGIDLIIAKRFF